MSKEESRVRRIAQARLRQAMRKAASRRRQRAARRVKSARAHLRIAMRRSLTYRRLLEAELAKLWNKNRPVHYSWMRDFLSQLAQCKAPAVHDAGGATGTPLFVVAGACPSMYAGMQCVLYSAFERDSAGRPEVDFWWIKPIDKYGYSASHPSKKASVLQAQTLTCHTSGKYKNSPGRSKQVYAPLAALFNRKTAGDGESSSSSSPGAGASGSSVEFGFERDTTSGSWRATMSSPARPGELRYPLLVWQEAWSSPLSRSRWIVGKIVYQRRGPGSGSPASPFYAAPYRIDGSILTVALEREESLATVLPPDRFKLGCDVIGKERASPQTATV